MIAPRKSSKSEVPQKKKTSQPPATPAGAKKSWTEVPLEQLIHRWQREVAEGLRDSDGRWIAARERRRATDE